MPELPEVETTCKGIQPHIEGQIITLAVVRNGRLRWPVISNFSAILKNQKIISIARRGKYILLHTDNGCLLIHLGMSGSLHIISDTKVKPQKHDHIDIQFENGLILRYRDPRRFGAMVWTDEPIEEHKLLRHLGPEPLTVAFSLKKFYQQSKGKRISIKQYIMDAKIVVGVGNIYANEALFMVGIRPGRGVQRVTYQQFKKLHQAIINVLQKAIAQGGTTLKDFVAPAKDKGAQAGYFQLELMVYGRSGQKCRRCSSLIKNKMIAQRNSFYCPQCQD